MTLRLVPPIHRATHRIGLYLGDVRDGVRALRADRQLSQGEAHILAHLATASPATIKSLRRGLAHKRSTLTSILDRLAERGLITREVGVADRRTFIVRTTPKGKQLARRIHRHLLELERAVASRVTPAELRGFAQVIATVEQEAHRRTGGSIKGQRITRRKSGSDRARRSDRSARM